MLSRIRRPSPALVIAVIALFVAIGGVSWAATKIGTNQIENSAVTAKKLHKKAVGTKKIKNDAVTGAKAEESSFGQVPDAAHADSATDADNLGGTPASSYQRTGDILFATVAPAGVNPVIVRGRGATAVTRVVAGSFRVTFNRDITGCTWLATYGTPDNSFVDARWATVRGRDTNTDVGVVLRDAAGSQADGTGFTVEVLCP